MENLEEKIAYLKKTYEADGFFFNEGADEHEIKSFVRSSEIELGFSPPSDYLEILKRFDGLVVEGVFLYSTKPKKLVDGNGDSLALIEMNKLSREIEWMDRYVLFGDSDQDVYVLDLADARYQVRDKQAFDNVYEEFDSFSGLLEYMVDLMVSRV